MRFNMNRFSAFALAVSLAASVLFTGCSPTTTGAVKEDVTMTGQTKTLAETGLQYRGPEYNIAILEFENKTPSRSLGVGEAATDIMRTIVKQAGLEPIVLTRDELAQQERLMELQQSGALKTGIKDATEGYDPVDFRIAGSVTAYHEVEETSDILLSQTKKRIARVQVDYSLVDVATGKSLVSDSGMGEYTKTTGGVLGMGSRSTADPGLRDGALRDALAKALTSMVEKLNSIPFTGKVLHVEGKSVTIRAGTRSRIEPGTVLSVYSMGVDLVDPDTGRVIGKREKLIGEIKLAEHQGERISEAEVSSGTGFKAGDVVKVKR
jgi:curli biogenesis system outer membrane secretion channel CsgG